MSETVTTRTTTTHFYRRRKRGALLPVAVAAVGLLGLGVAQMVPLRHRVEADLETRSAAALGAAGQGVRIDFTGRDGVVDVPAGSADQADEILQTVRGVNGVRVARLRTAATADGSGDDGATTAPTDPATAAPTAPAPTDTAQPTDTAAPGGTGPDVTVSTDADGVITVRGTVADEAARRALIASVTRAAGSREVVDALTVDAGSAAADGTDGLAPLTALLAAAGGTDLTAQPGATLTYVGGELVVGGTVASEADRAALIDAVQAAADTVPVRDELTVSAAPDPATQAREAAAAFADLPSITFFEATADLTPRGEAALAKALAVLQKYPAVRVEVGGHTDSVGSARRGLRLSDARANAVRDALIGDGIDADRLTAKGYGETDPLIENERTEDDRAANRRVAFKIRP